jgi:Flp pilus assembly protein TadD
MDDRKVRMDDLNAEIARRATAPKQSVGKVPDKFEHTLALRIQRHAKDLLREGRAAEAVALFEFALSQSPDDPALINNVGFCMIPVDPKKALLYLVKADLVGYRPEAINIHNQVVCHSLLGEYRHALRLITEKWDHLDEPDSAVLWRLTDSGLQLQDDIGHNKALAELAHYAAGKMGDLSAEAHWSAVISTFD